jgi:glycosyltransferase involved in cell wall biosynthesis
MPQTPPGAILHYVGYDVDRGGILAVIRALAAEQLFPCVLGVNARFQAARSRELQRLSLPDLAGDVVNLATIFRARRVAHAVRAWLREDATRVFHGHSRAGLLVALWLRWLGEKRVVATVHCYGRQRWFYRWAARRMDGQLYWLSPAMKAYYEMGDDSWDHCLPPGIRPTSASPMRSRQSDHVVCFGCVGGLVPVKQWELVLAALAEIPREVALRVVHAGSEDGSGESQAYAASLRDQAARAGVGERFTFCGEVTDMGSFYQGIDCLLIPSQWEAFSVAALEAGNSGVPVLAADAAGNRDLVSAGTLGWLFTANSASECARRMIELAGGNELRAWRPDRVALDRFSATTMAAQHRAIYRRIVEG